MRAQCKDSPLEHKITNQLKGFDIGPYIQGLALIFIPAGAGGGAPPSTPYPLPWGRARAGSPVQAGAVGGGGQGRGPVPLPMEAPVQASLILTDKKDHCHLA